MTNPSVLLFHAVCWTFGPTIEAFKHCRPIIGIDRTHLSGRYRGKLLVACGYDAEDQFLPLAFALVDKESNPSWENFMKFVQREVIGSRVVTVLSDRHASIMRLFSEPNLGWSTQNGHAYHHVCSRHICQNFSREFGKKLCKILRAALRQNQKHKFQARLGRIGEKKADALKWLNDIEREREEDPPKYDLWALPYDQGGRRFSMRITNDPESLNNVFKEVRELPVTSIVEVTFYKSVKYFDERRAKAELAIQARHLFAPKVDNLLEARRLKGNTHNVTPFRNERKYEVTTSERLVKNKIKEDKKHTIRLKVLGGACTCQKTQLTGIPCSHVLACCGISGINSNNYVNQFYRAGELLATWAPEFQPFGNSDSWPPYVGPQLVPDPALFTVKKGTRKHMMIRNEMDVMNQERHTYTCS